MSNLIHSVLEKLHLKGKPPLDNNWRNQLAESIREFENRKKYDVLNPDILEGIPDDELEQAIIDFVELKVVAEVGDDYEREYEVFTSLPKSLQAIDTTFYLEGEVYNGGLSQYLSNSIGLYVKEAVEGLKMIGAYELAQITEEAIEIEKREMKIKEKGKVLLELDKLFYELNETNENLSELRIRFIRQNPDLFTHS